MVPIAMLAIGLSGSHNPYDRIPVWRSVGWGRAGWDGFNALYSRARRFVFWTAAGLCCRSRDRSSPSCDCAPISFFRPVDTAPVRAHPEQGRRQAIT